MNNQVNESLNEIMLTFELSLRETNTMLTSLNMPQAAQAIINATLIQKIEQQATPQIEKARTALEAALGDKKDE